MPDIPGSVVVIAGASSGIGRALTERLARQGAKLVLVARTEATLAPVVADCGRLGADAIATPADVADAGAMRGVAEAALARHGRIDAWVNMAGIGAVGPFEAVPAEAHERVIRTNLLGEINGAHAALPVFKRQGRGTLVNMISVGGWVPMPLAASYTASKFGLRGFSEALRGELVDHPHIRVCDVVPSVVDTPALGHAGNWTGRSLRLTAPMLSPWQVADAIVDLLRNPRDEVLLGPGVLAGRVAQALVPGLVRGAMARGMRKALSRASPAPKGPGNLYAPPANHAVEGGLRRGPVPARIPKPALLAMAGLAGIWLARRL
jgi:short-subunit dehydrogenase